MYYIPFSLRFDSCFLFCSVRGSASSLFWEYVFHLQGSGNSMIQGLSRLQIVSWPLVISVISCPSINSRFHFYVHPHPKDKSETIFAEWAISVAFASHGNSRPIRMWVTDEAGIRTTYLEGVVEINCIFRQNFQKHRPCHRCATLRATTRF